MDHNSLTIILVISIAEESDFEVSSEAWVSEEVDSELVWEFFLDFCETSHSMSSVSSSTAVLDLDESLGVGGVAEMLVGLHFFI